MECVALVTSLWWVILDGCEVNEDVDGLSFLWSWLYILSYTSILLKKRILRSDLLLSKDSYRALGWHAHHNPKTVPGLPEFDSDVNSCDSCISAGLMIQTEVSFSCHCLFEMPGAKKQNFQIMWCPNHGWIYLLESRVGICLSLVWVYPSTSWLQIWLTRLS